MAYAVSAAPTEPKDTYLLTLKSSMTPLLVRDLCFADSSAYFRKVDDSTSSFLVLSEMRRVERDTRRETLRGMAIGLGVAVGVTVANYYAGGGDRPGAGIDRKEAHILTAMLFAPTLALFASFIADISNSKTLYRYDKPEKYDSLRRHYSCTQASAWTSNSDSSMASNRVEADAPSQIWRPQYQNLKPGIDIKKRQDSGLFARFPHKNRIQVALGEINQSVSGMVPKYWGVSATHLFTAMDGNLISGTVELSRTSNLEEIGSAYLLELSVGPERPLLSNLIGYSHLGLNLLFPTELIEGSPFFPLPLFGVACGLFWRWDRWSVFAEGYFPVSPEFIGARAGVGLAF
jgi:hypothetical protein